MPYRFKKNETFKSGFQRIVREELGNSQTILDAEVVTPKGIHSIRKSLKRLRSLMRLVAPAIGKTDLQKHNREIRDIAGLMAARRDQAVMQQTLQALKEGIKKPSGGKQSRRSADSIFAAVDQALGVTQDEDGGDTNLKGTEVAKIRARLERETRILAQTAFRKKGFEAVRDGLSNSYRAARKRMSGSELNPDNEAFHELRKSLQWHWHQMALLAAAWPELFEARAASARNVSQLLGEDHDLAVLNERVQSEPALTSPTKRSFANLCEQRQQKLRTLAKIRIQQLFSEKPAVFTQRIEEYWLQAKQSPKPKKRANARTPANSKMPAR